MGFRIYMGFLNFEFSISNLFEGGKKLVVKSHKNN